MSKMPELVRNAETGCDRRRDASDEITRRQIREAIDDPSTDIDVDAVFERLERLHAERMKAEDSVA
ncbi:type II toxin-antitoxin system ParD family antitoxin [Rhizobium sophoriradicis]|uniref:Type II toxin-antitoxin system ParD family antitoxin n=1 Tax=Rhizobium sophoriradicis TaxID=1535245 RepID=A0A2A5KW42_9HYPH|nr:type II toxin-antitoxin system ParD family antitoxin [Rhizobium sophoriradicis]RSC01864.1 type II toxin-antitoxin system ParD family antitoxin [Rhizobium sophoriradicis]